MKMLNTNDDEDAEVTWEDQQRINSFSKLNTRLRDIESSIEKHKSDKEALDDLSMDLELADEEEHVLYKVGEAFVHMPLSRAQKLLEGDREKLDQELSKLKERAEECEQGMKELKVVLYAKFGKAINLD